MRELCVDWWCSRSSIIMPTLATWFIPLGGGGPSLGTRGSETEQSGWGWSWGRERDDRDWAIRLRSLQAILSCILLPRYDWVNPVRLSSSPLCEAFHKIFGNLLFFLWVREVCKNLIFHKENLYLKQYFFLLKNLIILSVLGWFRDQIFPMYIFYFECFTYENY